MAAERERLEAEAAAKEAVLQQQAAEMTAKETALQKQVADLALLVVGEVRHRRHFGARSVIGCGVDRFSRRLVDTKRGLSD